MKKTVKKDVTTSESEQILNIAVKSLDDGKADDITVIDLQGKSSIALLPAVLHKDMLRLWLSKFIKN